jgi:hypothetical protein
VADPRRLLDVVWGAALYVFVADTDALPDDRPRRADLAAAVAALVAVHDGIPLADERYVGPDLMLATPVIFDRIDLDESGVA